jgi:hypothetical protein
MQGEGSVTRSIWIAASLVVACLTGSFYETMSAPTKDAPHVGAASAAPSTPVETDHAQAASSRSLTAVHVAAGATSLEGNAGRAAFAAAGLDAATATAKAPVGGPLSTERSPARDLTTLGPSAGQQSIKEVFAEDVVARRIAYGTPIKTLTEDENQGN